jgi:polysaccharide deacetylase family protein (PEP-CTERM system associated)
MLNVISVDVEDWFQVEAYAGCIPRESWHEFPLRVAANVHRLLDLFAAVDVRATFFVLGWVAERTPDLIRQIAIAGHEIASHGWSHTPAWGLTREQFTEEAMKSRALLQALTGQPVNGYRAPTFSVTTDTIWALECLVKAGYEYDSSVFPVHHDRYGIPDAPLEIHRRPEGLWELPLSVLDLGGYHLPVAGGGYFRLYPRFLTAAAIRRANASGRPAIVYVHPWEFDPDQPRVAGVSALSAWRHHVGIGRNLEKLKRVLLDLSFAPAWVVLNHFASSGKPETGGQRDESPPSPAMV